MGVGVIHNMLKEMVSAFIHRVDLDCKGLSENDSSFFGLEKESFLIKVGAGK